MMNHVEQLAEMRRLFALWESKGVYSSPKDRCELEEICIQDGIDVAIERARRILMNEGLRCHH